MSLATAAECTAFAGRRGSRPRRRPRPSWASSVPASWSWWSCSRAAAPRADRRPAVHERPRHRLPPGPHPGQGRLPAPHWPDLCGVRELDHMPLRAS